MKNGGGFCEDMKHVNMKKYVENMKKKCMGNKKEEVEDRSPPIFKNPITIGNLRVLRFPHPIYIDHRL